MKKTTIIFAALCLCSMVLRAEDKTVHDGGRVNPTCSPDSALVAFTRGNNLYVADAESGEETQLTFDGSELIMNGYASWVYYEEILGRPSRYRAFWWAPDSRHLAFYRFDNTGVPYFPIYSPFASSDVTAADHTGYPGRLHNTRYPKAGGANPLVRIGIIDLSSRLDGWSHGAIDTAVSDADGVIWADFPLMGGTDSTATAGCTPSSPYSGGNVCDGYFGVPFWSADSRDFYVPTLPRIQNDLNLFAVNASDGSKRLIYNEKYATWTDWFDSMVFGGAGIYVARRFETGWDQIYFISYDGSVIERLTDSHLWDANVIRADEREGKLYFSAKLDGRPRITVFSVDIPKRILRLSSTRTKTSGSSGSVCPEKSLSTGCGSLTALTPLDMYASGVIFDDECRSFTAFISNSSTPLRAVEYALKKGRVVSSRTLEDFAPDNFNPSEYSLPQLITMTTKDGFTLPALITYPLGFDASGSVRYPVVMEIYGGPDTPYVRDYWRSPNDNNQWFARNGIIKIVCDSRAAGHNGREGEDFSYRDVTSYPISDFCEWADYLSSLPYVDAEHIGVEGFSFGGTMTAMLLMRHSDKFCCGIAGGGVYDWALYDSHYTERFMETPQTNPEGYARACALNYVSEYPAGFRESLSSDVPESRVMLRLTHGTGDDNVHFQNTLVLIDALQKAGKHFELMIYPDGMHGYRGYQGEHSTASDHDFWLQWLTKE